LEKNNLQGQVQLITKLRILAPGTIKIRKSPPLLLANLAAKYVLKWGGQIGRIGSKNGRWGSQIGPYIWHKNLPFKLGAKSATIFGRRNLSLYIKVVNIFGNKIGRFGCKSRPYIWQQNRPIWQQRPSIYLAMKSADLAAKAFYILGNKIGRFGSKSRLYIWQQNRPIWQQRLSIYLAMESADLAVKSAHWQKNRPSCLT
jgi:hypothetical protein